jgi:hypothetical protein
MKVQQVNDDTRRYLMASALSPSIDQGEAPAPCRLICTASVYALPELEKKQLYTRVRDFQEFTAGNDPHQEHDFGQVEVAGERYFWKFDYYDQNIVYWQDPSRFETVRVLTLMHAGEY